jgi:spermidine synthase
VRFARANARDGGNGDDETMMRVVLGDCADVLRRREGLDIVFVDAFDGEGEIPSHLGEDAFLQTCGEALKSDGSLVLNMFNGVRGSPAREAVRDFARRLERWIGPVCSFPVMESPVNVVLSATKRGTGEPRPTREEFVTATKSVGERAGFEWSPHKLVEGAFWVDATGSGEMLESVAGGKRGVLGKFKGRNGTVMPREFENVLESD